MPSIRCLSVRALFCAAFLFLPHLAVTSAVAQSATEGPDADARAIVTIVPGKNAETLPEVTAANVSVKVDGKQAPVASLTHFGVNGANLQLVLLVDDSARTSLGLYFKEMSGFLTSLPPNVAVAVAYIENGGAHFLTPFTTDHAAAAKSLRLPASSPGANSSPYFALTSLIDHWPNTGAGMRHEVVMVSDGVDAYYGLRYDPEDPYVAKTLAEAQKRGVVVYSIYYKDRGRADRFGAAINSGQNYLIGLSEGSGGEVYYEGFDNPVSMTPFFSDISRKLMNQYELGVHVPEKVKDGLQSLKIKVNAPNTKSLSASEIFVGEAAEKK